MTNNYEDSCTHYWPEKVTKVKSMMTLYLKIYFMSCTNYMCKISQKVHNFWLRCSTKTQPKVVKQHTCV